MNKIGVSAITLLLTGLFAVACSGGGGSDEGADPQGGDATPGDSSTSGGDSTTGGDGQGQGTWDPPVGPYILVSPQAATATDESDALNASGAFVAEVRIGHLPEANGLTLQVEWDEDVLVMTSREEVLDWMDNGGSRLPGLRNETFDRDDNDTDDAYEMSYVWTAPWGPVETSEAILRLNFSWVGAATSTSIVPKLACEPECASPQVGVIASGSAVEGVTEVPLQVN